MVRRTKADAQATRSSLLDAAEHLFQSQGVSRTSLNDIATAAGTTRGAIYWHFKDKADLFNAMMKRVSLPIEETLACSARPHQAHPNSLGALRNSLVNALEKTAHDEQTRRVFEVATHKVEYVAEMQAVRNRHLLVRNTCMAITEQALEQAGLQTRLVLPVPLHSAALGLHVLVDGLIQNWLLDPQAFDLVACGQQAIDTYLRGLGFSLDAAPAPHLRVPVPSIAVGGAAPPGP
jgi:TetR/AcrR family acrAB operon transcriptional repressor